MQAITPPLPNRIAAYLACPPLPVITPGNWSSYGKQVVDSDRTLLSSLIRMSHEAYATALLANHTVLPSRKLCKASKCVVCANATETLIGLSWGIRDRDRINEIRVKLLDPPAPYQLAYRLGDSSWAEAQRQHDEDWRCVCAHHRLRYSDRCAEPRTLPMQSGNAFGVSYPLCQSCSALFRLIALAARAPIAVTVPHFSGDYRPQLGQLIPTIARSQDDLVQACRKYVTYVFLGSQPSEFRRTLASECIIAFHYCSNTRVSNARFVAARYWTQQ